MSVSERDCARAEAFGRIAAKEGNAGLRACPYEANGDADQRVLAARFVRAFIGAGGLVDVDEDASEWHGAQLPGGRPVQVRIVRRKQEG